jgi:RNA polymerase sigma factor (sigma-70 family)
MAEEERRLVETAKRGDHDSFNMLVRLYEGRLYNLSYRMLGDSESAADAAQDAFISAYRNLKSFRGGSFRSWLLRIATNTCYDILRARKRKPSSSLDQEIADNDAPALQIADPSETPDDFTLRREMAQSIQDAIAQLPEEQRIVVILSDIQGHSYDEIAEITAVSPGTVKSRLSRGRARLREILKAGELIPARYRHDNNNK